MRIYNGSRLCQSCGMLICVAVLWTVGMVLIIGAVEEAIVWSTTMMDWRRWWWDFLPPINSSPWYVSFSRGSLAGDFKPQKRSRILTMKMLKWKGKEDVKGERELEPVRKKYFITKKQRCESELNVPSSWGNSNSICYHSTKHFVAALNFLSSSVYLKFTDLNRVWR